MPGRCGVWTLKQVQCITRVEDRQKGEQGCICPISRLQVTGQRDRHQKVGTQEAQRAIWELVMSHNKTRANKDLIGPGTKTTQSISYDTGCKKSKESRLEEKDRTKQTKVKYFCPSEVHGLQEGVPLKKCHPW